MLSNNAVINENEEKNTYHLPASLSSKGNELHTDQLENDVVKFVQKLGIRPHLTGYHLLIKAILLSLKSPHLLKSLTKELYPMVAMEHGKNVRAVERNMRKAIESAYEYDPQRVQSIFYYKVDKPYISQVLSMAVESIRHKQ